jgi:hypothetical protein
LLIRTLLIRNGGLAARAFAVVLGLCAMFGNRVSGEEPTPVNPFQQRPAEREDALPGYVELSDGSIHPGLIYLTREKRLQIYDEELQRQREVPLTVVQSIECTVKREWMEKEWRFKETTSNEKRYTGRSYPSREYLHTIKLQDGRTISGPLACSVYLQPKNATSAKSGDASESDSTPQPEQYLLNKRNKGDVGETLDSLLYVKRIALGKEALEEGAKKAAAKKNKRSK